MYALVKIKIFSDFNTPTNSKLCFEEILKYVRPGYYGNNSIFSIIDNDEYTHAIILNTAMPKLKIPKKNVIGLAFEPYEFLGINDSFIEYAKKHISRYFIGEKKNLPEPFVEGIGYMTHLNPCRDITVKPNIMSIIVSNKRSAPGHNYRHELVKKIIELGLPIDIYGNGSSYYKKNNEKNIKGSFSCVEPYEKYMFTIAIENFKNNDYISEKFITPLMYNCKPIYWGANNILNYVDENDTILLEKNIERDIEIIKNILKSPLHYYSKTFTNKNIKRFTLLLNLPELFNVRMRPFHLK